MLDSGQFLLRSLQHGIIVVLIRHLRFHLYHVAVECRPDLSRHTFGITRARTVKYQVSAAAFGSERIGIVRIVSSAGLFGSFGLSGRKRFVVGTPAGYHRQNGEQQERKQ